MSASTESSAASVSPTVSSTVDSTLLTPSAASPTFSVPFFSSFSPRPSRGPGGESGGGGGGGPGFGSSGASNLYLYTFLATLVLLLLVSGAVVARSITLRVRARRAIEESIRNGTYIPPPRSRIGPNASKPVLYDRHIKGLDDTIYADEKPARWENLVPVAASFVPPDTSRPLPQPATSVPPRPGVPLMTRIQRLNPFRAVQLQDILDELASRDVHSRMATQQPPPPTQAELAAAAFRNASSDTNNNNDGNAEQRQVERPSAVRVAVLIAMPDPSRPMSIAAGRDDASSSRPSSAKGKTPASGAVAAKPDDEPEMPYIEFGLAEVPFTSVAPWPLPSTGSLSPSSSANRT